MYPARHKRRKDSCGDQWCIAERPDEKTGGPKRVAYLEEHGISDRLEHLSYIYNPINVAPWRAMSSHDNHSASGKCTMIVHQSKDCLRFQHRSGTVCAAIAS